ncbi:MAG: hypothetical protein U1A78_32220 [Polyangia bacterium]
MANPVFITDEDLYLRIGGRAALTQLMDPNKTGAWNAESTLRARTDACALVIEAAGVQADLSGNTVEEFRVRFPNLVVYACFKALYLSWVFGSSGQACPEKVSALNQEADAGLEKLATRRRKHGSVDYSPEPAQEVRGSIDMDPGSTRMTLASWRSGFC